MVNDQATLMRDGRPLVEEGGFDFSGLLEAEAAVAALASPVSHIDDIDQAAVSADPDTIHAIRTRLRQLSEQWRRLDDGAAIRLQFDASFT